MQRARETCSIAGFGDQAIVEENLREWDYGDAEGKTTKEMREQYNDPEWNVWNRTLVNGEAVEHVGQRADQVIADAARRNAGQRQGGIVCARAHPAHSGCAMDRAGSDGWRALRARYGFGQRARLGA